MSVRSTIGLLLVSLSALGLGVAAWLYVGADRQISPDQPSLAEGTVEPSVVAPSEPAAIVPGNAAATAGRPSPARVEALSRGPNGQVVTVPLKNRYRRAYGSQAPAGGGAQVARDAAPAPEAAPVDDDRDAAAASVVDRRPVEPETASPSVGEAVSPAAGLSYRVVERAAEGDNVPLPAITAPSFDIVRVDPDGSAVIAGRAAPLAEVEIRVGDEVVDRVTATARGEWVSIPSQPLAAGDQQISLSASSADGPAVASREIVVVSIPETEPTLATADAANETVAVVVDRDEAGHGRILQAPDKLQGDGVLALKMVDYDEAGAIKLSGAAPPGVPVRIYIDNQPATVVVGDSKGYWITTLDRTLPGGDYTLRLDQLDEDGQIVARLETPLTRVSEPPVEGDAKVDYVVVQPGNSLWRIARRLSGDGYNYVYIFEANEGQIRDPDVIYPGQVFEIPADIGVAG